MKIQRREYILDILNGTNELGRFSDRLIARLNRHPEFLTGTLAELATALECIAHAVSKVKALDKRLEAEGEFEHKASSALSAEDKRRISQLNHATRTMIEFMYESGKSIKQDMDNRLVDEANPMFDYEVEAKIDYQLREDDPEWSEDSDNYLSSRSEDLRVLIDYPELNKDWRESLPMKALRSEHLNWLLYDLTEHGYGADSPRLDLHDCLRVGTILLDIRVWWQYAFDVKTGKWIKRWKEPDFTPEYVATVLNEKA